MNCADSLRSKPSGGKKMASANTSRIGASVRRPRRVRVDNSRTENVMNADRPQGDSRQRQMSNHMLPGSCQDLGHNPGRFHAGELLVQTLERVVELVMVKAQDIEHRGMEIANLHGILYHLIAHRVSLAMACASFNSAPGHPDREGVGIVVTADIRIDRPAAIFLHGGTPEFTTPHYEGILQHAALFKIA